MSKRIRRRRRVSDPARSSLGINKRLPKIMGVVTRFVFKFDFVDYSLSISIIFFSPYYFSRDGTRSTRPISRARIPCEGRRRFPTLNANDLLFFFFF